TGGLGSDLFSVEGPTPANGVISNTLLGHSGIIVHGVESTVGTSLYSGIHVVGISANVADNDMPGVVVTQSDGFSQVVQGDGVSFSDLDQTLDSFSMVLTRPTGSGVTVSVNVTPPPGLAILCGGTIATCGGPLTPQRTINSETQVITLSDLFAGHFALTLDGHTTLTPLSWDATAFDVQTALESLSN